MIQSLHINRLNGGNLSGSFATTSSSGSRRHRVQRVISDRNIASLVTAARLRVQGPEVSSQLFESVMCNELLAADTKGHVRFPKVSTIAAGRYRVETTAEIRGKGEGATASFLPRLIGVDVETSFPGDTGKSAHVSQLRDVRGPLIATI